MLAKFTQLLVEHALPPEQYSRLAAFLALTLYDWLALSLLTRIELYEY